MEDIFQCSTPKYWHEAVELNLCPCNGQTLRLPQWPLCLLVFLHLYNPLSLLPGQDLLPINRIQQRQWDVTSITITKDCTFHVARRLSCCLYWWSKLSCVSCPVESHMSRNWGQPLADSQQGTEENCQIVRILPVTWMSLKVNPAPDELSD